MGLSLSVTTPLHTLVAAQSVRSIRAEDQSGSFGILAGHVDFLTVLPASVLRWKTAEGVERYCAMRSGLLRVTGGSVVEVACREGVLGDDLEALLAHVRALRQAEEDEERRARIEAMRMQTQTVRQMMQVFHPQRPAGLDHPPAITTEGRQMAEQRDQIEDATRRAAERQRIGAEDPEPSVAARLGQIGVLGWLVVMPILIGIVLGRLVDRVAESGIFFTAPAIFIGAGIGLHAAWKWMHKQ